MRWYPVEMNQPGLCGAFIEAKQPVLQELTRNTTTIWPALQVARDVIQKAAPKSCVLAGVKSIDQFAADHRCKRPGHYLVKIDVSSAMQNT